MSDSLLVPAMTHTVEAIDLPGSKSISNRVLLLSALASGETTIYSLLASDDTQRMLEALGALGVSVVQNTAQNTVTVSGVAGQFPVKQAKLFLGNAGTAFRPLTAALAVCDGQYELDGVARMRERPIGDLVDALRVAGAKVDYVEQDGFPPLSINPFTPSGVTTIPVKGSVSSQFLTALLMALPLTGQAYQIVVEGELISKPYIAITLNLMARFGVEIRHDNYQVFYIPAGVMYQSPGEITVEGDASSASYFLAAGLLSGKPVRVNGVGKNSIQGDVAFARELEKIGATIIWGENYIEASRDKSTPILAFDFDLNHIPDAAMTLAVVALAANGTSTIRNIESWRVKETDRIVAMATELRKLGAVVTEGQDYIQITPPAQLNANVAIDTYDDHRVAMCFALVSLLGVPVVINDPKCVNKTFPEFFKVFLG